MREILFRGKMIRPDSNTGKMEWVYGSLVHQTDYYGDKVDRWHIVEENSNFDYDEYSSYEVIPETVGQYTGLCDKNGTKIFEGDILKIVDDEGNTDFSDGGVGNVEFAYGLWYVSGKPQNGLWDLLQAYYCEVIGNIHDNCLEELSDGN